LGAALGAAVKKKQHKNKRKVRHNSQLSYAGLQYLWRTTKHSHVLTAKNKNTVSKVINLLAKRLEHPLDKPTESIKIELPIIPETTLEHKAYTLVEHLKEKVKPRKDAVSTVSLRFHPHIKDIFITSQCN
jgi:hypothetical protein